MAGNVGKIGIRAGYDGSELSRGLRKSRSELEQFSINAKRAFQFGVGEAGVHVVRGALQMATATSKFLRGDMEAAWEIIDRLPFGLGAAARAAREFWDEFAGAGVLAAAKEAALTADTLARDLAKINLGKRADAKARRGIEAAQLGAGRSELATDQDRFSLRAELLQIESSSAAAIRESEAKAKIAMRALQVERDKAQQIRNKMKNVDLFNPLALAEYQNAGEALKEIEGKERFLSGQLAETKKIIESEAADLKKFAEGQFDNRRAKREREIDRDLADARFDIEQQQLKRLGKMRLADERERLRVIAKAETELRKRGADEQQVREFRRLSAMERLINMLRPGRSIHQDNISLLSDRRGGSVSSLPFASAAGIAGIVNQQQNAMMNLNNRLLGAISGNIARQRAAVVAIGPGWRG